MKYIRILQAAFWFYRGYSLEAFGPHGKERANFISKAWRCTGGDVLDGLGGRGGEEERRVARTIAYKLGARQ